VDLWSSHVSGDRSDKASIVCQEVRSIAITRRFFIGWCVNFTKDGVWVARGRLGFDGYGL
jgi:hypothetical protein